MLNTKYNTEKLSELKTSDIGAKLVKRFKALPKKVLLLTAFLNRSCTEIEGTELR